MQKLENLDILQQMDEQPNVVYLYNRSFLNHKKKKKS